MPLRSDIHKGYGPTYHTIYDVSYGEFATDKPFCVRRSNIFETTPFFTRRLICHVPNLVTIRMFLCLHNHHAMFYFTTLMKNLAQTLSIYIIQFVCLFTIHA